MTKKCTWIGRKKRQSVWLRNLLEEVVVEEEKIRKKTIYIRSLLEGIEERSNIYVWLNSPLEEEE